MKEKNLTLRVGAETGFYKNMTTFATVWQLEKLS